MSSRQDVQSGAGREIGSRGTTVNNVQPGPIDSESNPAAGEWAAPQKAATSLDRYGRVDEVAALAQGFDSSQPHDSMGVGYCHTGISDDLKNLLSPVFDLGDVDGVELYYNTAAMKGFQLTSDLQVIDPADRRNDTAIVVGLRGTLGF